MRTGVVLGALCSVYGVRDLWRTICGVDEELDDVDCPVDCGEGVVDPVQ